MIEEIKIDNHCIVKAFENNPIAILQEDNKNKKVYYFKAADIGKALGIVNIHSTIQNYEDEDERVIRKAYDPQKNLQDTTFLTSHGVYRLLYNSKKESAKKFRKWAGNILDDIIFNESAELKKQLQEKEQLLLQKDQVINQLENKPETNGFIRTPGYVYMIGDTTKPGHIKIGFGDPNTRVSQLNVGSSTCSLQVKAKFETIDVEFLEKIIHYSLNPFRIKYRKEWFYFKNDFELAYSISVIKKCVDFVEIFDIIDYNLFKKLNKNLDIQNELEEFNKELYIKKEVYKKDTIYIKSEKYIGVWCLEEKNKWISKLQDIYLGIFDNEEEAAKTYNDYVMYVNQNNTEFNYILNDISNYTSTPRNIIEENYIHDNKICKYNGVSYNITRKYYEISIKLNSKTYHLGNTTNEIEAAKIFNQQALYFNQSLNTKYILNDIPNYITIAKNIHKDLQEKKKTNKTSNYIGVSYNKQKSKWRACYVLNKKQKQIGSFNTELEAAQQYNKIVIELNKNGCTYKLNVFDEQ